MSVTREVDVAGELWRRQSALPGLDCISPVSNDFNGTTDSEKLSMAKALVNQSHTMEKEEANNDVVDAEADSGEESEEEWNYIPGQENKHHSDSNQPIPSDDDMSQLNPNAAEFVPVLPSLEPVLSSSPARGSEKSLENMKVPSQKKFFKEISSRPADLDSSFENCSGNESTLNGDDLTGVSTKAVFGDDSLPSNMSSEDKREEDPIDETEKFDSTNPFADDVTQSEFVENHFEAPTSPLGKIEEEVKVDNLLDTEFAPHSEKPDLLSPIDNPHHASSNNEQQTSSSGFDSESGNEEPDFIVSDKCDLIADVPTTNENPIEVVVDSSNPFYIEEEMEKNAIADDEGAPLSDNENAFTPVPPKTDEFVAELHESSTIPPVTEQLAVPLMEDLDSSDNVDPQEFEHPPKFQFSDDVPLEDLSTEKGHESTSNENERLPVFNFSSAKPDESPLVQVEEAPLEAPVDHLLQVEEAEQGAESDSFELINHNDEDCDSMKGIQNLQEEERGETVPVEDLLQVKSVDNDFLPLQESSVDDVADDLIVRVVDEPAVEQVEDTVASAVENAEEIVKTEEVLVEVLAPPLSPLPTSVEKKEEESVTVETPLVEDKVLSVVDDHAPSIVNESEACVMEDIASAPLVDAAVSVDTPPPTPAAEAEAPEDSGLTAVAIGTTGIAAVAGAAAALISETKKEETKSTSKASPVKKPAATTSAKKSEPVSKTTTVNKTTAAPKSGAMKPSTAASTAAVKKALPTNASTTTSKTLTSRTASKPATSKPTTPTATSKPSTPTSRSALGGTSAKPTTTTTTSALKSTTAPKLATTSKPAAPLKTTAATAAATTKPRVGSAAAAAPAKTAITKSAVSSTTKKIEATKTTTARTTTSSRPTSATSTTTSRPSSATTRVAPTTVKAPSTVASRTSTTTTARPVPAKASSAATKQTTAATKTTTTTALKSATNAVKAPPTKTPATKSSVAPASAAKLKPASPTVVKKPGAADKTSNNKLSSTGKLVANGKKPSVDVTKAGKVSPDKATVVTDTTATVNNEQEEPVTQEAVVTTTTNGHLDNGVDLIDTSAYAAEIVESH